MKVRNFLFVILAICVVLIFTACDDGSSDSYTIGSGSGTKYVVTNSVPDCSPDPVPGKGIDFTEGGKKCHIYKTIAFDSASLDKSGKFAATVDYALPYGISGKIIKKKYNDSGTWSRSGQTITIKAKTQGGQWTATLSADGKTLTDDGAEPGISGRLIYSKQ